MSSNDARPIPQRLLAFRVTFFVLDGSGNLVTGAAFDSGLGSGAGKAWLSDDATSASNSTNSIVESPSSSGQYYLDLTAAEMNCYTLTVLAIPTTVGAKTTPIILYPEWGGRFSPATSDIDATIFSGKNLINPNPSYEVDFDFNDKSGTIVYSNISFNGFWVKNYVSLPNHADVDECRFIDCRIGTTGTDGSLRIKNSNEYLRCRIEGTQYIYGAFSRTRYKDCYFDSADLSINTASTYGEWIYNGTGVITVSNMVSGNKVTFYNFNGKIIVASTCASGSIIDVIGGSGYVDNTGGSAATVTQTGFNPEGVMRYDLASAHMWTNQTQAGAVLKKAMMSKCNKMVIAKAPQAPAGSKDPGTVWMFIYDDAGTSVVYEQQMFALDGTSNPVVPPNSICTRANLLGPLS